MGRLKRTTYPDATFTESTYDDAGRLVASRDARGKTTIYGYDRAGRRTSVKDPLLNETLFGYDANGNQTTVRDALGRTTTYEYDALNRRTKTIFPDLTLHDDGVRRAGPPPERDRPGGEDDVVRVRPRGSADAGDRRRGQADEVHV